MNICLNVCNRLVVYNEKAVLSRRHISVTVGEETSGTAQCLCVIPTEKPVSPKSATLKSPPKGFDTTAISKTYYNLVRTPLHHDEAFREECWGTSSADVPHSDAS